MKNKQILAFISAIIIFMTAQASPGESSDSAGAFNDSEISLFRLKKYEMVCGGGEIVVAYFVDAQREEALQVVNRIKATMQRATLGKVRSANPIGASFDYRSIQDCTSMSGSTAKIIYIRPPYAR